MKIMNKELLAAVALVVACGGVAQADTWSGGGVDNEFATDANWTLGVAPISDQTDTIGGSVTVVRSVDSVTGRLTMNNGATINVTGGTHTDDMSGASRYTFLGRGSAGTVNQSGGTYNIGHMLSVGGGGANGNGIYNLTGGSLIASRGSNSIVDGGANTFGRPSLEVSDEENAGSGLFEISGGSLATRGGLYVGQTGTFSVLGSGASSIGIGSDQSGDGAWLQHAGGTLKMAIDGGGVTSIFIDDVDGDDVQIGAQFDFGSVLDLSFDGIAATAGTWTLMEFEGHDIDDQGLGLSGDTASGWSFDVDNTGANGLLTATYVIPEPATLGLVAVFGGAVLFIRRRFMI